MILLWTNQQSCQQNSEIKNAIEVYRDTIVYLKGKNKYNEEVLVAKRRAWNNAQLKIENISSEKDSLLQRLKNISKQKDVISGTSFTTRDTVIIQGKVKFIEQWDTVYATLPIADTIKFSDKWHKGNLVLYPNSYRLDLSFRNTFDVWVENIKPGPFKSKVPYVFVKSHNPHSHIKESQSFAPSFDSDGFNLDVGAMWSAGIINAPGVYGEAYYDYNNFRIGLNYSYYNKDNSQLHLKAAYNLIKNW